MKHPTRIAVLAAALFCAPNASHAQSSPSDAASASIERRVVQIQGKDLIVDISGKDGATHGDVLELWRPLKVVHPVTRKTLTDRFLIGSVKLTQVQGVLSLARAHGEMARDPTIGDIVIAARRAPAVAPSPTDPAISAPAQARGVPMTAASAAPLDTDAADVTAMFESLAGASVVTRIRKYDAYASAHPESRFSATLREEAAALRRLIILHRGASREPQDAGIRLRAGTPPHRALAGTPLSFGVDIEGGASGAILHTKLPDDPNYASTHMTSAGGGYFVATVDADRVQAPGLDMFVEAITAKGESVVVAGGPAEPWTVVVDAVPEAAARADHRSSVTVLTDYADYNRLRGDDTVWQTEGSFRLRFRDVGVRALRSGFGVYRGVGGSIADLDQRGLPPREIGLTYGYLEGEFGFSRPWGLLFRGVLGLGDDGMAGGAQLHIRIGSDLDTNLTLGGEVLGGVGLRGIAELQLAPEGRFPIVLRSEVTNQPAGSRVEDPLLLSGATTSTGRSDVGIRVIAQGGYRIVDPLVVSVRGSYQGRTINHAGPGVGGAVTYSW